MLHLFNVGCGVGRQALHPSSPPATSTLAATSSEEEGLHARPLPHTFGEYFCVDAAYYGGGRIGTLPSSSQWRGVLRRRRDRPSSSQFQRVLRRGRDRPSPSQRRCGAFDNYLSGVQYRLFVDKIELGY